MAIEYLGLAGLVGVAALAAFAALGSGVDAATGAAPASEAQGAWEPAEGAEPGAWSQGPGGSSHALVGHGSEDESHAQASGEAEGSGGAEGEEDLDWFPAGLGDALDTADEAVDGSGAWVAEHGEEAVDDGARTLDQAAEAWDDNGDEARQAYEDLRRVLAENDEDLPAELQPAVDWLNQHGESTLDLADDASAAWTENREGVLSAADWVIANGEEIESGLQQVIAAGQWLEAHHPHAERRCGDGLTGWLCTAWDWSGADSLVASIRPRREREGKSCGWNPVCHVTNAADAAYDVSGLDTVLTRFGPRREREGKSCGWNPVCHVTNAADTVYDVSGADSLWARFGPWESTPIEGDADWVPSWVNPSMRTARDFLDGKAGWLAENETEIRRALDTMDATLDQTSALWGEYGDDARRHHGDLRTFLDEHGDEVPPDVREVLERVSRHGGTAITTVDAVTGVWNDHGDTLVGAADWGLRNAAEIERWSLRALDAGIWLEEHHPHAERDCNGNFLCTAWDWSGADSVVDGLR